MNEKKQKSMMTIIKSSGKMAVATFISRILGLVREQVMAHLFGASAITDAFLVAYRIPNLLRDLFAEGAFSAAFVPVFTEAKQNGTARELLWSTFALLTLITGVIGLFIFFFSDQLIHLFAPSFDAIPEKFQLASNLTKYMSPFLLFVSLAALLMGVLNTLKIFFVPSLAPALLNVVMIGTMLFFPPIYEAYGYNGVYALGLGVLIGGVAQFFIQVPLIFKLGYGPVLPSEWFGPMVRKILRRVGPGLIGFAAIQINLLVTTILASSIVGAVSWLNYAFRLYQFPVGIFGVSIGNTHLVHFSESYKRGDIEDATEFIQSSYLFSLFLMIPAMVFLFVASEPIVQLIFERGRFNYNDTLTTALLLKCYALSLPFYGIYKIMIPTFYTLDKQRIPITLTLISISLNILFCLLLVPKIGVSIFALATSLTMFFNASGCMILLSRILNLEKSFFFTRRFLIVMISGLISFLVAKWMVSISLSSQNSSLLLKVGGTILIALGTGVSYLTTMALLGEKRLLKKLLRKK